MAEGNTLVMAWATDATGLDPHKQTAFASLRLLELVYEPLVILDADLAIRPGLAESWAFADDGLALTFTLRDGATFQNGEPVTAADVKASYERILDEATGAATRANFLSIESIETPDAQTVVFGLSQPDAPMLTAMTDLNAAILPASAIAADTVGTEAIGSGPFVLEEWKPNEGAMLRANADWWGDGPSIDGIEIRVIPDESAILAALRAEQIDFALLNDPIVASLVAQAAGEVQLNRAPALAYHVLQLNAARPPMDDLRVRQAISCAIDRQQVLDTASLGEGQVTGPLTIPAYRLEPAELFCYQRDVEMAKRLLGEAGVADLTFEVIAARGEPPTAVSEAQNIQAQLSEVGIALEIVVLELNVYVDRWLAADFDMAVANNSGRADPYTMYGRYWTKAGNLQKVANYIDDDLDALMQAGRVETDPAARVETFAKFQKHLVEMAPWVWLYNGYEYTAQQPWVQGFVPMPNDSLYGLSQVSLQR
jgi:peptide/nickel transport system substrate-binding protein